MSSSKGSSKYKSTFGSLGGGTSDSKSSSKSKESERSSSKRDESSRRTKDIEEEKKSSSKSKSTRYEESESKSRSHRDRDRDRDEEKSSRHRSRQKENGDDDYKKSSSSKKSHSRKDDDEEDERKDHRRSSKHREDRDEDSKKHREHKSDSRRRHRDKDDDSDREAERNGKADEKEEEPNYEDDFDDDFEKDESSEEEVKKVPEKKSSSLKEKSSSRKTYDSDKDDEDDYKSRRDDKRKSSEQRSRNKYADYDDYADEENYRPKGRVVKANAHVNVPTDLVEVYSSEIYFNHDSRDRQKRRAKDLFKSIIELDNKSFSLLDINPVQMRTVYSSHLKHEKVQTNDDTLEIEAQTDEIETTTRWTQHPADDLKGYGIENQKFNYEASNDVLEQFRTDINVSSLQKFLQKSSKVIETLLREDISLSERRVLTENKSELDFSQGFSIFSIPKFLSKLAKTAILTNVVFAQDNMNHLVCSYDVQLSDLTSSTLLLVWDIDEPTKPYRVLICETMTTCLCYFSFIVVAGSMDGSIVLWDLRESPSLHSQNLKKINEANVIRSPTYATAGVLLEENHMSEVRSILPLQNQGKDNKDVFVQLATLEVDCKLIIWTVIELTNNVDSAVFEKDLGLLPGGRIQLVKSFEINLNNIIKTVFGRSEYQTWSLAVSTEKKNHFFISTNIGQIIHIERKGKSFSRTVMKSSYSDLSKFIKTSVDGPDLSSDGLLTVKTVSFHPEISDILLVSYGNGEIRLYDVNFATPIKTWLFLLGTEIKEARWIESRSSSFIVLNEDDSKLFVWDLLTDDTQPVLIKKTKQFGCISFPSVRTKETIGGANKDRIPFAYFDRNSQELQVHLFSPDWTRKSDKESKKFAKLIKNYILTF